MLNFLPLEDSMDHKLEDNKLDMLAGKMVVGKLVHTLAGTLQVGSKDHNMVSRLVDSTFVHMNHTFWIEIDLLML